MPFRRLLALTIVLGCAGLLAAPSPATAAPPPRAPTLFVLRGQTRHVRHELTVRTRSVEWFTDRPERRAGTMSPRTIVRNWQAWGFADDPPNAALTGHDLDVVVELSKPRVRGGRLRFHEAPVRGRLPRGSLGAVSAFVDATSTAPTSTVQVVNQSGVTINAFVFVLPGDMDPEIQSLAWLSEFVPNEAAGLYPLEWDASTQAMWAEMDDVGPGSNFNPQQTLSLPLTGPSQVGTAELTQKNGAFSLTPATVAVPEWISGSIGVETSGSVSPNTAATALGLSGSPALAEPANPYATTFFPVSGLTYWITSQPGYQTGDVLPDGIQLGGAAQLIFAPGVTSLTATLDYSGNWDVRPSSDDPPVLG